MRCWNYLMIPYLPDNQLRGQWKECALIAYGIEKYGTPNHLLVNKVMEYPIDDFLSYCSMVRKEMYYRGFRTTRQSEERLELLGNYKYVDSPFKDWHNKEYLRSNMANLWEKHFMGVGKSRITDIEWENLLWGYKKITGEEYMI